MVINPLPRWVSVIFMKTRGHQSILCPHGAGTFEKHQKVTGPIWQMSKPHACIDPVSRFASCSHTLPPHTPCPSTSLFLGSLLVPPGVIWVTPVASSCLPRSTYLCSLGENGPAFWSTLLPPFLLAIPPEAPSSIPTQSLCPGSTASCQLWTSWAVCYETQLKLGSRKTLLIALFKRHPSLLLCISYPVLLSISSTYTSEILRHSGVPLSLCSDPATGRRRTGADPSHSRPSPNGNSTLVNRIHQAPCCTGSYSVFTCSVWLCGSIPLPFECQKIETQKS